MVQLYLEALTVVKAPTKRRILWVDDEVELLLPHRLVLEQKGYRVDALPNVDDALSQLRRQTYDLVLLDQQMPGRTGIEMLREIRGVDPALAVVMVTKSEEEETLSEAIARRVSGYLVKPTSPRQVLSAVTRVLEGPGLRHEQLSMDFVRAYPGLQNQITEADDWRDWADLYSSLVNWELELSKAEDAGLADSLYTLLNDVRREFSNFIVKNYAGWVSGEGERPTLAVDVVSDFFLPLLAHGAPAALVIVDCMRLDQWRILRQAIEDDFEIEEDIYLAILPTSTPYSRNAIFSGLYPDELAEQRPGWPANYEKVGLNSFEDELFAEQIKRLTGGSVTTHYEKCFTASDAEAMLKRLPTLLGPNRALGLVFNFVDLLTHGRAESQVVFELARDASAMRRLISTWFEGSELKRALKILAAAGVRILLTSDHGSVHCHRPTTVFAKRDATPNLRYKYGDDLRAENPTTVYTVSDGSSIRLPRGNLKTNYLIAREDYFFVYPTKLREYQSRYRDSFLHGGISPEEMIVPAALLKPRGESR